MIDRSSPRLDLNRLRAQRLSKLNSKIELKVRRLRMQFFRDLLGRHQVDEASTRQLVDRARSAGAASFLDQYVDKASGK